MPRGWARVLVALLALALAGAAQADVLVRGAQVFDPDTGSGGIPEHQQAQRRARPDNPFSRAGRFAQTHHVPPHRTRLRQQERSQQQSAQ